MADSPLTSSLQFIRRPTLRFGRITLSAANTLLFDKPNLEVVLPEESPAVIVGSNGSGKSLFTAAVQLAVLPIERANDLRADLLGAGLQQIAIDLDYGGVTGRLVLTLRTGERTLRWSNATEANNGRHTSDGYLHRVDGGDWESLFGTPVGAAVFSQVNFTRSGESEIAFNDDLIAALRNDALEPDRRELRGWKVRLSELAGEESGGRLGLARERLREVEERVRYVDEVRSNLDAERRRQEELLAQEEQLTSHQNMVKAELEEWMKLFKLADRARRIHVWLDEIQREHEEVAWLCDQHEKYQQRLDDLEKVFRGAPDNLDEVLESYQHARLKENALLEKLHLMRMQGAQLEEAIATARKELESCVPPSAEAERLKLEERRARIEEAEQELTELLRGRVELVREREGLQSQLQRDFPLLFDLDAPARRRLVDYFEWEEKAEERVVERKLAAAEAQRRAEEKLRTLQSELNTTFAGYESLPGNVTDSLRVLFDCRRLVETMPADVQELESKHAALEQRTKGSRNQIWTGVAAVGGAIAGALLGGWDIALFFALAASGVALLTGKLRTRGVENQLSGIRTALSDVDARRQDTEAMIQKLKSDVGPLGQCTSLSEALGLLNRYRQLTADLEQLLTRRSAERSEAEDEDRKTRDEFAEDLPAKLLAIPVAGVRAQFTRLLEAEAILRSLDLAWNEYEGDGTKTRTARQLESKIAQFRQELEMVVSDAERKMQTYESRRRELNEQLTVLESARAVGQTAEQVEAELIQVRAEQDRLLAESGGFLERVTGDALTEQVRLLRELRTEIRKVRDSLSSRQSVEELRARESLLSEELDEVKQKLSELDPLYLLDGTVADYAAKYNRQLEGAGEALTLNESALDSVRRDLDAVEVNRWTTALSSCESPEALQEQAEAARAHLELVEHETAVARETVLQLQTDCDEQYRAYESELLSAAGQTLRVLSDGRCSGLNYSGGRLIVELPDGSSRNLSAVSAGTRDLVWVSTRLAMIDQRSDSPLMPVIWDEPFSRLDDNFLQRVRVSLGRLAETRQVVILTRDHRLTEWGVAVHLAAETVPVEPVRA